MGADVYNAVGDLFYSSAESALEGIERRARRLFALRGDERHDALRLGKVYAAV